MPTHLARARAAADVRTAPVVDRTDEAIGGHLEDAAHYPGGRAEGIARPVSAAEVAALVRSARHLLPIGAQSSVTGGATPCGGLVVSSERLTTFEALGPDRVRAGAGLSIDALQSRLAATGRWYAPYPTFTGATVGGIVATNAAGAATFKYGSTRAWVEGLTVVLACGCVLDLTRGDVVADRERRFELRCEHGTRHVQTGSYRMPAVAKCSAGYFAGPDMDLIDLFVGSEGTLAVVVDATLRVLPVRPSIALVMVPVPTETSGLTLVSTLRDRARATWAAADPGGLDVAAIEHLDRRCLEVLREDGVDRRLGISLPSTTDLLLLVQLELPLGLSPSEAFEQIAAFQSTAAEASALGTLCRLLHDHAVLDDSEIALPDQARRAAQILEFREGAPTAVNRRVGESRRKVDSRIDKTAADMIVPFDRFADMMAIYREGYSRRGLDYAIWGHISDGNVHPNVIPKTYADVVAGREAILEFGREATRLGGSPLAEHGVGRSALKQRLLREFHGERGIAKMRAIKDVLDPDHRLAPGVLFGE
jgi:D-lactate dehydrogenase (cytochrome)